MSDTIGATAAADAGDDLFADVADEALFPAPAVLISPPVSDSISTSNDADRPTSEAAIELVAGVLPLTLAPTYDSVDAGETTLGVTSLSGQSDRLSDQLTTTLTAANGPPSGVQLSAKEQTNLSNSNFEYLDSPAPSRAAANVMSASVAGAESPVILAAAITSYSGDHAFVPGGVTSIDISGTTEPVADQITVSGAATLGGKLTINVIGTPDFQVGQTFDILTYGSVSGDFIKYENLAIGNGLYFKPTLANGKLTLTVATTVGSGIEQPLFFVPGFGGTFAADESAAGLQEYYLTRGIHPDKLALEPLSNSYSDIVQSFVNLGYTPDLNLFVVKWDWRVPVGLLDGVNDGSLAALTAGTTSITDSTFESGLDYLGYYLNGAKATWQTLTGNQLSLVNMVTHSTGGLLSRSYIQSTAYPANPAAPTASELPAVKNLVQVGVPNEGVSTTFAMLGDDFSLKTATRALARQLDVTYDLLNEKNAAGEYVRGLNNPDGTVTFKTTFDAMANPQAGFVAFYVGAFGALLPAYDSAISVDGGATFAALTTANGGRQNDLLLDLNFDANPLDADIQANSFVDKVVGTVTIIYGSGVDTADQIVRKTGIDASAGITNEILAFDSYLGQVPASAEVWYLDTESAIPAGDGTVPARSAAGLFTSDSTRQATGKLILVQIGTTFTSSNAAVTHTGLTFDVDSQKRVILAATSITVTTAQVSQAKLSSLSVAAMKLLSLGLFDLRDFAAEAYVRLKGLFDVFGTDTDGSVQMLVGFVKQSVADLLPSFNYSASYSVPAITADLAISLSVTSGGSKIVLGGTGMSALLGASDTGVSLSNGEFGLVVYDDGTYAVDVSGAAAIVGVPELVLKGTLRVLRNTSGAVSESIVIPLTSGGSRTVNIVFSENVALEMSGTLGLVISDFVYVSGGFSFAKGPVRYVDVVTGLASTQASTVLTGVPVLPSDDGTFGRNGSGSVIYNLPVQTLEFGLSGVDVFVGYTDSLDAAAADGNLTLAELELANAVGVFLDEVNLAMVLMRAIAPPTAIGLSLAHLRFFALQVDAANVALLGVPELWLSANNLQVRLNQGSYLPGTWGTSVAGFSPPPVVDFALSFPDNSWGGTSDADALPDGYQVRTSPTATPVKLLWTQPLIGVSADRVLFRVSDFVYVSGGFSFNKGPVHNVDVRTGLTSQQAALPLAGLTVSATDPTNGSIARNADGSMIWNLPVQTLDFGLSAVDVFVGYTDSLDTAAADGDLTPAELTAANAIGVFLDNVDLGMVLMRALPVAGAPTLTAAQLKFFALKLDAANVALVGVPELWLSANNLQVRLNQGSGLTWPTSLTGPPPVVDFELSFPDNSWGTTSDSDSLPDGYQVQTSTTNTTPVKLLWSQPLVGVSADQVLFRVSDFVYISGGFSFNKGNVQKVDVRTGLTSQQATLPLAGLTEYANDPGAALGRSPDGSMIWNLPVQTLDFGLSAVDVFVGYTDSLVAAAADGDLTSAELAAANAIGVFLDNVDLGMVLMRALPVTGAPTLTAAHLKFFALKLDAANVALVGVPELWLSANNLQMRLNQGSALTWPTLLTGPQPVVDFALSFPDNSWGATSDADTLADGYQVQTSTTNSAPVKLLWSQPLLGVSADRVLFRVSDFVYVSGTFSFNKGPVKNVDIRTGLTSQQASLPLAGLTQYANDPGAGVGRTPDGSMIWNLPVQTLDFGMTAVDVFVGYASSLDTAAADGDLTPAELTAANAVGVFLDNVDLGMVLMRALPVTGAPALTAAQLKFFALKLDAANVALVGVPELWLSANNLQVRLNQGSAVTWPTSLTGPPPVVDFELSFPDNSWGTTSDSDSLPDGYQVQTSTTNTTPVKLLWSQPLVGVSADRVLFRVSDFVYISGGFSFNKGPVKNVDVRTGLTLTGTTGDLQATALFGSMAQSQTDPTNGSIARNADSSIIWNLPVQTLDFGLSGVDVFVGYTDSLDAAAADGDLTVVELAAANATGVFLDNIDLGMVLMSAQSVSDAAGLNVAGLKFFALQLDAANVALVGVPELWLSANNLQVRLNQGSFRPGSWGSNVAGANAPPVVDFAQSFPDNSWNSTTPDDDSLPDGYQVRISTTNSAPVKLLWDQPLIGVSADNVLLRISDFVYLTGSFSFNQGPTKKVDVRTGLTSLEAGITLAGVPVESADPVAGTLGRKSDGSMLWNLPVETLDFGMANVDVFVGYAGSLNAAAADGNLTLTELQAANAVGVFLDDVSFGMVLMRAQPGTGAPLLDAAKLKFFAVQATASNLGLVGVPEIQLLAQGAEVRVNQGSFLPTTWGAGVPGVRPPPVVDFQASFPDDSWSGVDDGDGADGYRVPTNTSGAFIPLLFDQPLIAGGAEKVTIQISQFVYLTGSIYFEKGPVITAPLVAGLAGDPSSLGVPSEYSGTGDKQLQTMTIGATNVNAFVGLNGPYWIDSTTGLNANGLIDRDALGSVIPAEINSRSTGLVIDNLSFGLFIGTPTTSADPTRYVALKASAQQVALVGIEGITASANGIAIELNLSTPGLGGLPVLPVINFSGLPGNKFGVKTGAKDALGNDVTIDLTMSTALIRAQGFVNLNIFGSVYLSGSMAFELGPTKSVTLSDGSPKTVRTMSIGVANVNAFIGANGPYWSDTDGDKSVDTNELSTTAVGFSVTDFDAGLLIMTSTETADLGAYVAMKASVTQFGLVNMPAEIAATGTFDIAINLGVGTSGIAAVNFVTSFPATTNPVVAAGYRVNTGDASSFVLLDFTGPQITLQLGGNLSVASVFDFTGVFLFDISTSGLKVFVTATLAIGPTDSLFNFSGLGVLVISNAGIAADIELAMSLGTGMTDMTMSAVTARLILNTTGAAQSVTVPQKYVSLLSTTAQGRLSTAPDGSKYYAVAAGAPRLNGTTASAGTYLVVNFSTTIRILGFDFVGNFQLAADATQFQLTTDSTLNVAMGTTTIFRFQVRGDLLINSSGRIAAGIDLTLATDFTIPSTFGLTWGVTYQLRLNTGSAITLPSVGTIANGFGIRASGTLGIPGLTLTGSFDMSIGADKFTIAVNATVSLFGTTLTVTGIAGLYYDTAPGFVLNLQLKLGSNTSVTVSPVSGFTINGAFVLAINTSTVAREGVAARTFQIGVTNLNVNLFGFTLTGSLTIAIGEAGLSIDIPAPGLTLNFFNVVTLNVTGYLRAGGQFSFTASASVTFLDPDVFGFDGTVAVSFSNSGFSGSIDATFGAFGIKVHGFGSFSITNGIVSIAVGISLQITPAFSFRVWTPWKTYTVNVPALVISGTWRYTFGALTTATVIPPAPNLATKIGTTLRLNIGVDAGARGSSYPAGDESYVITRVDENTVRVAGLGHTADYDDIAHILVNDTLNSNNYISIAPNVTATAAINVGKTVTGTNRFYTGGAATVHGGSGNTTVVFGPSGGSFTAGSGQNHITDNSTANNVTVYAPGWLNYNLSDGGLNYGNGVVFNGAEVIHTITFVNVKRVVLNGATDATYEVSSLPDPNDGAVSRWTGNATFNGAGAASVVRSSTATNVLITDTALTESGVSIALNNLKIAQLYGNAAGNTFTVSGWTGAGAIDGKDGTDTLVVTNNTNFNLSNTLLTRTGAGNLALASIEVATLTGGDSINAFTVGNWTGSAALNGVGAADSYTVNLIGSGSGTVTINDTGASGTDTLIVNGTSAADVFGIAGAQVARATEIINYLGIESVTVNGLAGEDTFNLNNPTAPTTVNGGVDADIFAVAATAQPLTLNGDGGADTFTVQAAAAALVLSGGSEGDTFKILSLGVDSSINTGTGINTIHVGTVELPALGNVNSIAGKLTIVGGGTDTLNVNDSGDTSANSGLLTSTRLTGLGMGDGTKGVDYSSIETLLIALGSGGNTFNVRSTSTSTTTTLRTGTGSATVDVGSGAGTGSGGNANGMGGKLTVQGQGTGDILNVDDTTDTIANTGVLTSTRLTGLGMGGAADGIEYTNVETLNVSLGTGGDTFNIQSTFSGTLTTLNTGTGSAANTVNLGSLAPANGGDVNTIAGKLIVNGQSSLDTVNLDEVGDTLDNSATLTSSRLTGLGMGDASKGLEYNAVEVLNLQLGSGVDTVVVTSTHTGLTTLSSGGGDDHVHIASISGETRVRGGAGGDQIKVNVDAAGLERVNASGATINGIGGLLDLDGEIGSDTFTVYFAGTPYSATHVVSLVNLNDTGSSGTNTLLLYGPNSETISDNFLVRRNFIALLPPASGGIASAERINYNGTLNGGVTIHARAGNDYFAFDDTSTTMTVNTGDGKDVVQIGQMFQSERVVPHVAAGDEVTTVHTTSGYLTPGVGFPTTINGGIGDDQFVVLSNKAALQLNGEAGDDSFVVRAFALYASQAADPARSNTSIDMGTGADYVEYNINAPVSIEGGDGTDKVVVVGTEFSDHFIITAQSVTGAGLRVAISGIELLEIDGMEGNDRFTVLSTPAGVVTRIFGGRGSDLIEVGGQAGSSEANSVAGVQGPLVIEGGVDPTADRSLAQPLLYLNESNATLQHVAPVNPNLTAIEADQIDSVFVYNSDAATGQTGSLTQASISGLGMGSGVVLSGRTYASGITYADLEMVSIYLGRGTDTFEILNTHSGSTLVHGGDGADTIFVRTVLGHTSILGGAGDDTITLGASTNSQLTIDRLRALVTVDGGAGLNVVTIDDRADTNDNLGTLTPTSLTGLDLIDARIRTIEILNARSGTFTITIDGRTTDSVVPLSLHASSADIRRALLNLNLPGVSDIVVNRAGNLLTLVFAGDELPAANALAVSVSSGGLIQDGSVAIQVNITDSLPNRVQTITLPATNGTFGVSIGASQSFQITVGATADTVRDAIILALNPTQSLSGVGIKDIVVAKLGNTYEVRFQGLLSGNRGANLTLAVATSASSSSPTSFSLNAMGGTFRLNLTGTTLQTSPLAWNASADAVAQVLNGILGSTTISVSKTGTTFSINFGGLVNRIASVDSSNLVAPIAVAHRTSGINYYSVGVLNLQLGSGNDVLNIRGTSAVTNVFGNNGDDRLFISSLANETLASAGTTDFLRGNLDQMFGTLNLDLGDGRHRLMISDEAAIVGDGTAASPARITDQPVTGLGLPSTEITLTGLTPAPAITYKAASSGSFADGITIWTGWGNDIVSIDGTHQRGSGAIGAMRTVTSLNTGLGDDTITVNLNLNDGFFVLNTQGPENAYAGLLSDRDNVFATNSIRPLIIFGGQDIDNITGGQGADIVFGDRGLVTYYNGAAVNSLFGNGGPGDRTDGIERAFGRVETTFPAVGGIDTLYGLQGRDLLLGGFGSDTLDATGTDAANDIIIGDNGVIQFTAGILTQIDTIATGLGGGDTITAGAGAVIVFGGVGDDNITITGDSLGDLVVGDNGTARFDATNGRLLEVFTTAPADAGRDTITTAGSGRNVILGGSFSDEITSGSGDDVIVGDNGRATFATTTYNVLSVTTTDPSQATSTGRVVDGETFDDVINAGAGNNVVFGGSHSDHITTLGGADIVVGDNGSVSFEASGILKVVATADPTAGGNDKLRVGDGNNIVLGGFGSDSITAGSGADVIIGDGGEVGADSSGKLTLIQSDQSGAGGVDTVNAGSGDDIVIGGVGADVLMGDGGSDLIFGDNARIDLTAGVLRLATAADSTIGGADKIYGGDGNDLIVGGALGDEIWGDAGHDVIFGDFATLTFSSGIFTMGEPTFRDAGGADVLLGGEGQDVLIGGSYADRIDGGAGDDLIAGDNASIDRTNRVGSFTSLLFRSLSGTAIYDIYGIPQLSANPSNQPGTPPVWADFSLTLLDHSVTVQGSASNRFGNDYIAGGAGNDRIFGGLGNDTIQGDGSISLVVAALRLADGTLQITGSVESASDGDDYIEGNGGDDLIFGGLGQDDIIGGSSNLFGLVSADLRPDGKDLIFGGAGTDVARNDEGDTSTKGRARDADVITGDNAAIVRLVATQTTGIQYMTYGYDNYDAALKIIPRAVTLLDYVPGNSAGASNIGGPDEIHGESGNDLIYGQVGNDVLFGEGQDDDLIGGTGSDWISGGTGDDGVIGDDGFIKTSRNGLAEPLHGVDAIPARELDLTISTPGDMQLAVINVKNALKKTAVLEPFTVIGNTPSNDIIFGGLDNDFLHGGAGDDAISGAEALPEFYANPFNSGNVLEWGKIQQGEFAAYDEYNPLAKINGFILNFDRNERDGADVLFGDAGNDWLVGGPGRDHLYGGYGDDLLNADDDLETNNGRNDIPDTLASHEDIAYGGAGRDILIGNTGGDRLIDFTGEFNSYIVPFAPFGAAAISRAAQPALMEYLYNLSAGDGADPTRAAKTGSSAARNGEPEGELGLVKQSDFDWGSQTGSPSDPQPGNIPGGTRDVLRSANFNNGTSDGFAADSGTWQVSGGRLQVAPTLLGDDAVSVFYVDSMLPRYFEVRATINAVKPIGGYKANTYLVFDYQSPTDFKFAGIDIATDKLQIGHRDASGWVVDKQINMQVKAGEDYNLLLSINGLTATLVVDGNSATVISFAFSARVEDGYSYGLNSGQVGIGAQNAKGQVDNLAVQVLPPVITFQTTEDFSDGKADLLNANQVGQWAIAAGRSTGTPAADMDFAASNFDLKLSANSLLQIDANVRAGGNSASVGVVFDYYSAKNFKFAALIGGTNQVVIGHHTNSGWVIDAAVIRSVTAGTDYNLSVILKGTTVNVALDDQPAVAFVYNSVVVDGQAGLFTRGGASSFGNYTVKTDDFQFAVNGITGGSFVAEPTSSSLDSWTYEISSVNLMTELTTLAYEPFLVPDDETR